MDLVTLAETWTKEVCEALSNICATKKKLEDELNSLAETEALDRIRELQKTLKKGEKTAISFLKKLEKLHVWYKTTDQIKLSKDIETFKKISWEVRSLKKILENAVVEAKAKDTLKILEKLDRTEETIILEEETKELVETKVIPLKNVNLEKKKLPRRSRSNKSEEDKAKALEEAKLRATGEAEALEKAIGEATAMRKAMEEAKELEGTEMVEASKKCHKCPFVKPLAEFSNCKGSPDGKADICKQCCKEYKDSLNYPKITEGFKICPRMSSFYSLCRIHCMHKK